MVRDVILLGDPLLRTTCTPVGDPTAPDVATLAGDLRDTVRHWRSSTGYGRAIAAPQIGELRRVVLVDVNDVGPMVNPEIVERSEERMTVWDGCLSFLAVFCQVERHRWIRVRFQDLTGAWRELRADGDLSELIQHEVDHLDGILTVDRMTDVRTLVTREEFERRYRAESPYAEGPHPGNPHPAR